MDKLLLRLIVILSIIGLILPGFVFTKETNQPPRLPETWDEILAIGKRALNLIPQTLKGVWQEAVGIWQKMINFFKNLWDVYIWSKIELLWQKILAIFGKEVEKKKETIPQELEKEKKEIQQETSKASRGFWQKLKDIIPGI